jgi:hypothetical protein
MLKVFFFVASSSTTIIFCYVAHLYYRINRSSLPVFPINFISNQEFLPNPFLKTQK